MALNRNTIVVFDLETGSASPSNCEVLELAAVAMDPRSLEIKESDLFHCYLKPTSWDNVQQEALAVNKLDKEFIEKNGVELKLGWNDFVKWVKKYDEKNQFWSRPIPAGHNIINFDLPIIERLATTFGQVDKDGRQTLFHNRDKFDLMFFCSSWFENASEPANYKLDTLREYFGLSSENAHRADTDIKQTALLLGRFLKFQRNCFKKANFKNACKNAS